MRSMNAMVGVTMALCLLASAARAAEMPASIARCKAITDDTARLACYDAATGRSDAGYITASSAGAAAANAGAAQSGTPVADATKPANSFESRIRTATRLPAGTWVIALEDGTSWIQADSSQEWIVFKAGDAVVVSRGAMGAWFLKKSGSNRTFRVRPDTR